MLVAEDTMKATARSGISTPCFSHFTLNETKTQKINIMTQLDFKLVTEITNSSQKCLVRSQIQWVVG